MTSKTTTRDIPAADTNIGLGTARKPVKRPWRERFRRFFYNKEEGSYLGRTPLSWIQILLFYFFFFACLLGFWMLCWFMFSATMTEMSKGPRWQIEKSVIGKNPGDLLAYVKIMSFSKVLYLRSRNQTKDERRKT